MTMSNQLELWNDEPTPEEPWQTRMQKAAFAIAFPEETLGEKDKVTVFMDFDEATEGYAYSEWTFDEGSEASFCIQVRWDHGTDRSSRNPANIRPLRYERTTKTYEGTDALKFWLDLMRS